MPAPSAKSSHPLIHLRRRAAISLLRTWREVKGTARQAIGRELRPDLPKEDLEPLKRQMQLCLDGPGGEITARAHTAQLGRTYLKLSNAGRVKFLKLLA